MAGCNPPPSSGAKPHRPNILLISLDACRADRLGCYGCRRDTSPFLDQLARRGTRFTNAFVNTHGTPPSHVTMLSGLYQETHRVSYSATSPEPSENFVPDGIVMLPEMLRSSGYYSIGVTDGGYMSACQGFDQGFDMYFDGCTGVVSGTAKLLELAEGALRLGKPVFAFLHTYQIHSPYQPPEKYRTIFGTYESDFVPSNENLMAVMTDVHAHLSEADIDFLSAMYDGGIRYTDDTLRSFFARLKVMGFCENWLVIVTSDHGEEFGEHGGLLHGVSLYDEILHIPLIVAGTTVTAGTVDRRMASMIDIAPTILSTAGAAVPPALPGTNLVDPPISEPPARPAVFSQYADELYSIRTQRWKLIEDRERGTTKLYDLVSDPGEQHDLSEERPDVRRNLLPRLRKWRRSCTPLQGLDWTRPAITQRDIDRLKLLGYLR